MFKPLEKEEAKILDKKHEIEKLKANLKQAKKELKKAKEELKQARFMKQYAESKRTK